MYLLDNYVIQTEQPCFIEIIYDLLSACCPDFFSAFCAALRAALACFLSSTNACPCVGSPMGDRANASLAVGER